MTPQDRAVIALSVYNAVSLTGRDMTVDQVVAFLSVHWDRSASPNAERVSVVTVADSAKRLAQENRIMFDGKTLSIPHRDPQTLRGPTLNINYETGAVL